MAKFSIKNNSNNELATIIYDKSKDSWALNIRKDIDLSTCPVYLYSLVKHNRYKANNDDTLRFIRSRIIPSSRQNIYSFLKKYNIAKYNEYDLLKLSNGKCCLDDCYIELVSE